MTPAAAPQLAIVTPMMLPRSIRALARHLHREIARSWLLRTRAEQLAQYPQLAGLAFDHATINLAVDGRIDKEALAWIVANLGGHLADSTTLDIGANIGNHALAFAECGGRVIALEPHPLLFALLEINCRLRPNVEALNLGASDRPGSVRLATPRASHGCTRIAETSRDGEEVTDAEVAPLDSLLDRIEGRVGLVKIDVEGHEEQVLRGATALLGRDLPIVILEQHPDAIEGGTSASVSLLRTLGYHHLYTLEAHPEWRTPDSVPRPLRRVVRGVETLLFGPPARRARCRPLGALEKRTYPMLIASTFAIAADGDGR